MKIDEFKREHNIRLSAVVATDSKWAIGRDNTIPWRVPSDLKRFKDLTMGHHMIMGRKTYESIGGPLPGRMSIVCTRNPEYVAYGSIVVNSLQEAVQKCPPNEETFIVGGESLYVDLLPYTDLVYLTEIHTVVEDADTHFPKLSPADWLLLRERREEMSDKDECSFTFKTFLKSDLVSQHINW